MSHVLSQQTSIIIRLKTYWLDCVEGSWLRGLNSFSFLGGGLDTLEALEAGETLAPASNIDLADEVL